MAEFDGFMRSSFSLYTSQLHAECDFYVCEISIISLLTLTTGISLVCDKVDDDAVLLFL